MSWPGREVHLSILDSLCLLSLLSVAHICFSLGSLLFGSFLFTLLPSCPVSSSTRNSLYCNKFPPIQVLNKV